MPVSPVSSRSNSRQSCAALSGLIAAQATGARMWSRWPDLNRRPADYESAALPAELQRLIEAGNASNSEARDYSQPLPFVEERGAREACYIRGPSQSAPQRAPLAQLDRATVFGTVGWGFEPLRARQSVPEFLGSSVPRGTSGELLNRPPEHPRNRAPEEQRNSRTQEHAGAMPHHVAR
jgi:hypothetical protein